VTEGAIYGGQTASQRREQRRAQLLEAALELIGQGGWAALTVRQVCATSSLTARYFYESFSDREALALAIFDALAAEATQRVLTAVDGAPGGGLTEGGALNKARAAISAFVELVGDQPRNALVLFAQADGLPELIKRRVALTRTFALLVENRGRDFYGLESTGGRIDTAATMLAGGLAQTLLDWTSGVLLTTREALVEDCAVMFVAAGEAAVARARSAG
jgi:AcrR family transcriptional regulator